MLDRHAKVAFFVLTATLLVAAVGFNGAVRWLDYFLAKEPVPLRDQFANIPRRIGGWEALGRDAVYDEAIIETLGTDQYLSRAYRRTWGSGEALAELHLAYYTGLIDAIPHVPDRCFLAAGLTPVTLPTNHELPMDRSAWYEDPERVNRATGAPYPMRPHQDPITGRRIEVRLPIGDYALRTIEFEHKDVPAVHVFGGYVFIANGRITPSPEEVKLLAFDMGERYAYFCKVQVTMALPAGTPASVYVERVSDLLSGLLPEVMRCLPDWSEIELAAAP
jgi:hypothetical protein